MCRTGSPCIVPLPLAGKPRKQADRMAGGSVYCRLRLPRNLWGFGDAMQFAKVALRRPVGPSWSSLAHWASTSLLPPLAALGSHSSQRSRCVGPWGLPGAPLLTGLPPRSSRHWRRSALPPRRLSSALAAQGELSRRDKRRPPGGVRQIRKKPCVARVSLHGSLPAP